MATDSRVVYRLSMPRPHSHLFHIEMELPSPGKGPLDVAMCAWTPGSYAIRNYAKHLRGFRASGRGGRRLPFRKIDKQTWRVEAPAGGRVLIRYQVYAFDLTPRGAHLDASHGYFNGAAVFLYPVGRTDLACRLEIRARPGWRTFTGLARIPGRPDRFVAPDYDTLVDCPVEIGPFAPWTFRVAGKPHRVVVHGEGNYERRTLVRDLARIVRTQSRFFGGLPYREYLFLIHCTPEGGGGLEHANSTSLQVRPHAFWPPASYRRFLHLASHEFFHLWNVKRIRPIAFARFDYSRENHTPLLWAMEGVTDYYAGLLLVRAGLLTTREYLDGVGEMLEQLHRVPGRLVQSLADASFDAWTHHYEPNEDTVNRTVSYYTKGAAVGLCLDLAIRKRTRGRRSLDDVMRLLFTERLRGSAGIAQDGFERAVARVAGNSFTSFFRRFVHGTTDPDFGGALRSAGLDWKAPAPAKDTPRRISLGIRIENRAGAAFVAEVLTGSAAFRAGLYPKDEIVAIDRLRIDAGAFDIRVESILPGRSIRLTLFRRGRLREISLRPDAAEPARKIRPLAFASPDERRLFHGWIGTRWKKDIG